MFRHRSSSILVPGIFNIINWMAETIDIKDIKFTISFFSLFLILFLLCQPCIGEDTCIKCHTDENMMKALYKPAKIEASEGEG